MRFAALLLAALVTGCAATPPLTLEERFYQNAFYNEEIEVEQPLFRWEEPIRVYLEGAAAEDRRHLEKILAQIAAAAGLSASIVDSPAAEVRVYFVTRDEWREILDKQIEARHAAGYFQPFDVVCMALPLRSKQGRNYMFVVIPKFRSQNIRRKCIAQEVGHVTGLRYDAVGYSDTAFGDWAAAPQLTEVDFQLLKILYDPRLRNGMTWREAQPIVRRIINEGAGGS